MAEEGNENPADELSETPEQESAEDSQPTMGSGIHTTETEGHVQALMDAAHNDRVAREEHGRTSVQAGP